MSDSTGTPARSAAKSPGLHERMRANVRAEVSQVAFRLFAEQGFDQTTVDQIAAEAGVSRASLFRYFGTKEDIVLGHLENLGNELAEALAVRPRRERPWEALRRTFDVIIQLNEAVPERSLRFLRMLNETPSLRARHSEKQLKWQSLLVPDVAARVGARPDLAEDPGPTALVASALGCLDAATGAWVACEGAVRLAVLLDRAMDAVKE